MRLIALYSGVGLLIVAAAQSTSAVAGGLGLTGTIDAHSSNAAWIVADLPPDWQDVGETDTVTNASLPQGVFVNQAGSSQGVPNIASAGGTTISEEYFTSAIFGTEALHASVQATVAPGSDVVSGADTELSKGRVDLNGLLYYWDTFTFSGPPNTTFLIRYDLAFHRTLNVETGLADPFGINTASAEATLGLVEGEPSSSLIGNLAECVKKSANCLGIPGIAGLYSHVDQNSRFDDPTHLTGILKFHDGDIVQLGMALSYDTHLENSSDFPYNSWLKSNIDAVDTGYFTLNSLTPGASFTTASGLTYTNAPVGVPEPVTWTTVLLGLFSAGSLLRRKRALALA